MGVGSPLFDSNVVDAVAVVVTTIFYGGFEGATCRRFAKFARFFRFGIALSD